MLVKILCKVPDLRLDVLQGLEKLVVSNTAMLNTVVSQYPPAEGDVMQNNAEKNLQHLALFASQLLANFLDLAETGATKDKCVWSCIDAYLSITSEKVSDTVEYQWAVLIAPRIFCSFSTVFYRESKAMVP